MKKMLPRKHTDENSFSISLWIFYEFDCADHVHISKRMKKNKWNVSKGEKNWPRSIKITN